MRRRELLKSLFAGAISITVGCHQEPRPFFNFRALENSIFYLYVDANLNAFERGAVRQAADLWEQASNGRIRFIMVDYVFGGRTWQEKFKEAAQFGTYISNFTMQEKKEIPCASQGKSCDPLNCGIFHSISKETGYITIFPAMFSKENYYVIIMHELGHLLGLGHSDARNAVMYPISGQNKALSRNDVRALEKLYKFKD